MTLALTILGPVWAVLSRWLPAVSALRSAAMGAAVLATLGAGAWLVWMLRHQDEAPKIERAARAIVDKANLQAHVEQLEAAISQGNATLAAREKALAESGAELAQLKKDLEDKRNASPNPDDIVIPAGDPWLGGVRR
jgi:uncharacterized protein HemX